MKYFRLVVAFGLLGYCLYFLGSSQNISDNNVPPLAKFFDPFHGFFQNGEGKEYLFKNDLFVEGIEKEISVYYDSLDIPHIYAENENDLYYAQGYIIAQHRLWQMEFQTLAAAGRVSEVVGKAGLDFDRTQRRIGMLIGAKATFDEFQKHPEMLRPIQKYADGVNAYIKSLSYKNLPIEYKLLNYAPEEWTVFNSALLMEYMINNLIGWDNDLENTNALKLLGKDTFDILFPDFPEGTVPVVSDMDMRKITPLPIKTPDSIYADVWTSPGLMETDPNNGSNNWAVTGEKTSSGRPLIACDPHLGLNLPSLWILNHLKAPGVDVMGYSFTGAPGIVFGFNNRIAWGFTNSPRDQRDWYHIRFKDRTKKEYFYDSSWKETKIVVEEIKVKGEKTYYDTVYYTHHGPIVYDESFPQKNSGTTLALKWSGHLPSRTSFSFYHLNRGQNYEDYKKALEYWDAPSQNVIFACTNGDIAIRPEGTFPLKWKEQGKFILDGSNPEHEWAGFIPHDHNPFMLNPERGYVSSANQHQVTPNYPYYVYNGNNEAYRNRRINRLLEKKQNLKPQDFMKMQQDAYSIKAEEILPLFIDSIKGKVSDKKGLDALDLLQNWDYQYLPELKEPLLFEMWWRKFYDLLWDEFKSKEARYKKPSSYNSYLIIKNRPDIKFIDRVSTPEKEELSDLILLSFEQAIKFVDEWSTEKGAKASWGNFNNVKLVHLAQVLTPFNSDTLQVPGSADVINSSKGSHGPSLRMVVEMTDPPMAWGVYAGGQSGNPGSPRYMNYLNKWATGKYFRLVRYEKEDFTSDNPARFKQTFKPQKD